MLIPKLTSPATLPVQGVKAITYLATCPDKQVVLTLLCSLLNTVCSALPSPCLVLMVLCVDNQIQSCFVESPVRPCRLEGSEADSRHLLSAVSPCASSISHSRRWTRSSAEELLSSLLRAATQTSRLSILSRRDDEDIKPTCRMPFHSLTPA